LQDVADFDKRRLYPVMFPRLIEMVTLGAAILAAQTDDQRTEPESPSHYPWKTNIVTTVFWIGEPKSEENPKAHLKNEWDSKLRRC
jgi:hypothetical protein